MESEPRLYDMSFWIKDDGSGNAPEAFFDSVKTKLSQSSGTLTRDRRLEKRMLAYPIQKQTTAWWAEMQFTMLPQQLLAFKDALKYEDAILRKVINVIEQKTKRKKARTPLASRVAGTQQRSEITAKQGKEVDAELDTKLKQILETE